MEEKKINVEEAVKSGISLIAEKICPILGKIFYVDSFVVEVMEDGRISVTDQYNNNVVYSVMTEQWVLLAEILSDFTEDGKNILNKFFGLVMFPVMSSIASPNKELFEKISDTLTEYGNVDPDVLENARIMFEGEINSRRNG